MAEDELGRLQMKGRDGGMKPREFCLNFSPVQEELLCGNLKATVSLCLNMTQRRLWVL